MLQYDIEKGQVYCNNMKRHDRTKDATVVVAARISRELYEKLVGVAKTTGFSMSDVVARILAAWTKKSEGK